MASNVEETGAALEAARAEYRARQQAADEATEKAVVAKDELIASDEGIRQSEGEGEDFDALVARRITLEARVTARRARAEDRRQEQEAAWPAVAAAELAHAEATFAARKAEGAALSTAVLEEVDAFGAGMGTRMLDLEDRRRELVGLEHQIARSTGRSLGDFYMPGTYGLDAYSLEALVMRFRVTLEQAALQRQRERMASAEAAHRAANAHRVA
jgi:hypothetical protein